MNFLNKSKKWVNGKLRGDIQENIDFLSTYLDNVDRKMKRPGSIFEQIDVGNELSNILVEISSYMIFDDSEFDNNLKAPKNLNKEEKKSYENTNKQILDFRNMLKAMMEKENTFEKKNQRRVCKTQRRPGKNDETNQKSR